MPIQSNPNRAVFYSAHDLAVGASKDRVCALLGNAPYSASDINDAIELIHCYYIVKECPFLFEAEDLPVYQEAAKNARAYAMKEIGSYFANEDIASLYEKLEIEYIEHFWKALVEVKGFKHVKKELIYALLSEYPHHLRDVVAHEPLVKAFDSEIRLVLIENPKYGAELIINCFAVDRSRTVKFYLPDSISNTEIDELMLSYLASGDANPNYVCVLAKWPSSANYAYTPSPNVLVEAGRKEEELNAALFSEGATFGFGITVAFSETQRSCKSASFESTELKYVYGTEWLRKYTDPGTILNNLIYIFELVDYRTGLLLFIPHEHEEMSLIERLGIRSLDEYRISTGARIRIHSALLSLAGYGSLLEDCSARIEEAIAWFFNEHIEEEFGIKGFSVGMPSPNTSYSDKCKAIGPEIERVAKAFSEYVRKGQIDDAYFPHISFKRFSDIPSLIDKKYIVEGEKYMQAAHWLFSDQSPLVYLSEYGGDDKNWFSLLRSNQLKRVDFHIGYQNLIQELIEEGFIEANDLGYLHPSRPAFLLKRIWDEGAFPTFVLSEKDKMMIGELVEKGYVKIHDGLFSPDESDYCNFVFNDALFSNPLALRNRHDHASSAALDPDGEVARTDYIHLLLILVGMTLKINEELCIVFEKGGVEDFVDWPLVEEREDVVSSRKDFLHYYDA